MGEAQGNPEDGMRSVDEFLLCRVEREWATERHSALVWQIKHMKIVLKGIELSAYAIRTVCRMISHTSAQTYLSTVW